MFSGNNIVHPNRLCLFKFPFENKSFKIRHKVLDFHRDPFVSIKYMDLRGRDLFSHPHPLDHEIQYGQIQQNCHIWAAHECFSIARA